MDKSHLTPIQRQVTQEAGTEPAFTGEYWDCKEDGMYKCVVCGADLFSSDAKFDSNTGWPSFTEGVSENQLKQNVDKGHGMVRDEVVCGSCDAHLGHVFDDGPVPTGKRFCINSAALNLEPKSSNTEKSS